MKTKRIYVVSFAPAYDETSMGGHEWRSSWSEARSVLTSLTEDPGSDFRLITLDVPDDMDADEITDFLSSGNGVDLIDPPDPRVDLDEALELWRSQR